MIDFVMKSGRALMLPTYKDTFERLGTVPDAGTNAEREEIIEQANDLQRSIDYPETRGDINIKKLAFLGISWGGTQGSIHDRAREALSGGGVVVRGVRYL